MTRAGQNTPRPGLRAEVISVGTELVQGLFTDTNSGWVSSRLAAIGIPTDCHTTVGDDEERLVALVREAASRTDVLIITGGLGPTADDITRQAVARAAGLGLVLHQPSLERIAGMFARWGRQMSENNRSQAYLPEGADVIPNNNGTAPGILTTIGRATVMVFPGVPHELYAMMDEFAVPHLRALQPEASVLRVRMLRCFGPGESQIDQKIRDLMAFDRNPNVGLLVHDYVITVKITAQAASPEAADALTAETECEVRERLGDIVFGVDDETMAAVVARELIARGKTVALAESCTGGMIAERLTDISGVSACFLAGIVSYSNKSKRDVLGVSQALLDAHGAVSEPVARAMAEGARRIAGADVALSVTGVAGPTGGTAEKPVGLVYIALSDAHGTAARECRFIGARDRIRTRTALTTLDMLRRWAFAIGE